MAEVGKNASLSRMKRCDAEVYINEKIDITNLLKYIDKIIHEWTKKGFKTMQDVSNHLKNRSSEVKEIKEYDWLNE